MGQLDGPHSSGTNDNPANSNGKPIKQRAWYWLTQDSHNGTVLSLFLLLLICFGFMAYALDSQRNRVSHDEYITCSVQHKALPADRALLKVIGDEYQAAAFSGSIKISKKLTPFQSQVLEAILHIEGIAPATLQQEHVLAVKTAKDTAAYRTLEVKVPSSRHC